MTDQELDITLNALEEIADNYRDMAKDYVYNKHTNEFHHKSEPEDKSIFIKDWFTLNES
jgi:hypothetical protein